MKRILIIDELYPFFKLEATDGMDDNIIEVGMPFVERYEQVMRDFYIMQETLEKMYNAQRK